MRKETLFIYAMGAMAVGLEDENPPDIKQKKPKINKKRKRKNKMAKLSRRRNQK